MFSPLCRMTTFCGRSVEPSCLAMSSVRYKSNLPKRIKPQYFGNLTRKVDHFQPPDNFEGIEIPERPKLRMMTKVPNLPLNVRPPKMTKRLDLIRGPEEIHNQLMFNQFGIVALCGGRLKTGHLEMIRLTVTRKLDPNRMFAIWRIDDPWQPISKRGLGKRHGGGKGAIDHYVTPIKEGRIIIEVGGKCVWEEVYPMLAHISKLLPFAAKPVNEKILLSEKKIEEIKEQNNINPYTLKYLFMNRMVGCREWIKDIDKKHFGKYV